MIPASPSAALVRCLTPPQEDLHLSASVKGPALSHEGVGASVELAMDVNLARGEVEIFKIDLPERSQAKEASVPYSIKGDSTSHQINLGKFSVHMSGRAWGFAGASLLVSGGLKIGIGNAGYGASLDPIQPATRKDGTASIAKTSSTPPLVEGRAGKARIEDGAKAGFNLFAGLQAGITVTGALNWAPPSTLVSPTQVPNMPGQPIFDGGWLSLARLEGGLAAAIGGGFRGDIGLSLSKGCLILRIKAALIAGPGMQGSLSFAVGYEAITELLDLRRRELHNNQQRKMEWITDDAMKLLARLNIAGALGIDVGLLYLLNHANEQADIALRIADAVMNVYEAIISGGRGGLIAHSILKYENQAELEKWFVECIPQGLGPMLMTLISTPKSFEVIERVDTPLGGEERKKSYTKGESHLFQQQAIEQVLRWIVNNAAAAPEKIAAAQHQFDEACSRMNKFGSYEHKGQVYCDNRDKMDLFMKEVPIGDEAGLPENISMRKKYLDHVKRLGALRDGYCKSSDYYGKTYLPGGRKIYVGPGA